MIWFSEASARAFAALAAALLILAFILFLQLRGKDGEIATLMQAVETGRADLARCEAARAIQNAAIAQAGAEAERQRKSFADALAAGNRLVREARGRVTIVRRSPPNGCPTPPLIRGADL
jgi:hypothetical protein